MNILGDTMKTIKAQVGATIRFKKESGAYSTKFFSALRAALTKEDPRYFAARSKGRRPPKGVKQFYKLYTDASGIFTIPSGEFETAIKIAKKHRIQIEWVQKTQQNRSDGMAFDEMGAKVRDYQLDAIELMFKRKRGVMVAGCGAGKTTTGVAFSLNSGQATLVLTHSMDLLTQWVECFEWLSKGSSKVRVLGGTKKKDTSPLKPGEICVATIQTLSRDVAKYKDVMLSAGAVLIDECHHSSSETWLKVINKIPARYRIGFTATPERADGMSFVVNATIGSIFYRVTSIDLVERGYLRRPNVLPVRTQYGIDNERHSFHNVRCNNCGTMRNKLAWDKIEEGMTRCRKCKCRLTTACSRKPAGLNFSRLETDLMAHPERLRDIADLAARGSVAGRKVLVLISRNESGEALVDMLTLMGIRAASLTGKTKKADRERILNKMRFGDMQVIVSARLADEGLSVNNLDLLILGSAGKFGGIAAQRIGRLSRQAGADTPLMIDLVDNGAVFRKQFQSRSKAYTAAYGQIVKRPVSMDQAREILNKLRRG